MLRSRCSVPVPRRLSRRLAAALRLRRPLVFIDLETTGLDPQHDRILEIAALRIHPDGTADAFETVVDAGVQIPPQAERVHGIGAAQTAGAPRFDRIATQLIEFLAGADLAGYNLVRFDLPLLQAELARTGHEVDLSQRRLVDPYVVFRLRESRDLQAAHRFYCGGELGQAHAAAADVVATARVLAGQLQKYPDLEPDVAAIDRLVRLSAQRRDGD